MVIDQDKQEKEKERRTMRQKITEDLAEPQESGLYFVYDEDQQIINIYKKFLDGDWINFSGDYLMWGDIISRYSLPFYEIESLSSYVERQQVNEPKFVTFMPKLLAEKLSADGEFVTIEADNNKSFSCSQCDFSLQKEGWFTDSTPNFCYCPNCGGKAKYSYISTGE